MKKKKVEVGEIDIEILRLLYKTEFMSEVQIAVMVGENHDYVKGRLKKLCRAGLIGRKTMDGKAMNYIKRDGVKEVGLAVRNIHEPKLGRYEHCLGTVDGFCWLSIKRLFKDGSVHGITDFGRIITERDFNSVKEMRIAGYRADGQPIYKAVDKDIHAPDGFFQRPDGYYCAIEFERVAKSSKALVRRNVFANARRFTYQWWFFDDPYVGKVLHQIQTEIGKNHMNVRSIREVRSDLERYLSLIPTVISQKSGIPRRSCLGQMVEPISISRIPLLPEYKERVAFEQRATPAAAGTAERTITQNPIAQPASAASVARPQGKSLFERR